jgi:hypothetical protein
MPRQLGQAGESRAITKDGAMTTKKTTRRNPGEGDLFFFHGAFNARKDAFAKVEDTPGSFIRPVYFRGGMRYAVLTPRLEASNPKNLPVVRWQKPAAELTQRGRSHRSNHVSMRPRGPKVCALCGSDKNIVLDHKNGNNADIRRGNHRWLCNSCNIAKGYRDKRAGRGVREMRRPGQNPPKVGSIVTVKLTSTRKKSMPRKRVTTLAAPRRCAVAKKTKRNPIPAAVASLVRQVAAGYAGAKLAAKKAATKTARKRNWKVGPKMTDAQRLSMARALALCPSPKDKSAKARKARSLGKSLGLRKRNSAIRKNPLQASRKARKTYEMFHGRKPKHTAVAVIDKKKIKLPGTNFAKIGDLVSLTIGNHKVSFDGDTTQPIVVTDAKAKKLFFLGGNQDLRALKPVRKANPGGLHDMGEVSQLEYYARKKFDQFKPTVYYHELGEETGKRPKLMWDPTAKQMYLVGGDYKIKDVGIVN